jgi:hypothetical protein
MFTFLELVIYWEADGMVNISFGDKQSASWVI